MEKINRCKTSTAVLVGGFICQLAYTVAYVMILFGQNVLRNVFYGTADRPNIYPIVDILIMAATVLLISLLFFLVYHKATDPATQVPEVLTVIVCGLLLTGLPFSVNIISNMIYGSQGSEVIISYSLFTAMTAFIRPLSRLAQVLMMVGAMASIGNKRAARVSRN